MQVCKWLFPAKDSHRRDTAVSLTGTSLCFYAIRRELQKSGGKHVSRKLPEQSLDCCFSSVFTCHAL